MNQLFEPALEPSITALNSVDAHTVYLIVAYGATALLLIGERLLLRAQLRKLERSGD